MNIKRVGKKKKKLRADKLKPKQEIWEKWDLGGVEWEKLAKIFEPEKESILKQLQRKGEEYPRMRDLLIILAAGSFFSASLIMPGLPLMVAPWIRGPEGFQKRRLTQNLERLRKQRLVEVTEEGEYQVVKITQRGRARALKYKVDEMKIAKSGSWDRKWRLVLFDIPEKHKQARDFFRQKLRDLKFYPLQESVFVYPYPCFEEVEFLRQIFHLADENIRYGVLEKIEDEGELRRHFKL